jgi:hypothetical protein
MKLEHALSILATVALVACGGGGDDPTSAFEQAQGVGQGGQIAIVAHRGASGYLPEHTLEAYAKAIDLGADVVEPDRVSTKDGVLIARHEPNLVATTDVALKFPARKRTAMVDGVAEEGYFASDFTLAEIKALCAVQAFADRSQAYNGQAPPAACSLGLPRAQHRADRRFELLQRALRKGAARVPSEQREMALRQLAQVLEAEVALVEATERCVRGLLEGARRHAGHQFAEAGHQAPVGVSHMARVAGLAQQAVHRGVAQAHVEQRVHHARHRRCWPRGATA